MDSAHYVLGEVKGMWLFANPKCHKEERKLTFMLIAGVIFSAATMGLINWLDRINEYNIM